MRLSVFLAILIVVFIGGERPAEASSDNSCGLDWKLDHRNRSACNNMAILHPGNDTRVNLMLLMSDQTRSAPLKSGGDALFGRRDLGSALFPDLPQNGDDGIDYPSRCQTNKSGTDAYINALKGAKGLVSGERNSLIEARQLVEPDCEGKTDRISDMAHIPAVESKMAEAFRTYLWSALAFYRGNFDEATVGFSGIVKSKIDNAWLREASLYMIARSELNRSQIAAFGRYGWFEGPDATNKGAVKNAERGFELYLKQYPKGQFANSARGLMRRVYWLGGNSGKLSNEYAKAMKNPASIGIRIGALVEEIDNKLLPVLIKNNDANDPALAAMILLYRMREPGADFLADEELPNLTTADLNAAKSKFASQPKLFEYLQAVHAFYVEKNPTKVIKLIPDDARQESFTYLEFSRQALRGMALEADGDNNARGFWKQVMGGAKAYGQRDAVELALAMNLERGGALEEVFSDASPITDRKIRDILLLRAAGPDLLRQQSYASLNTQHERDLALYTLLYKSLTRGRYSDFLRDVQNVTREANNDGPYYTNQYQVDYGYGDGEVDVVPLGVFLNARSYEDYACPQLKKTVTTLKTNPNNQSARICLAEFLRISDFDDNWLDSKMDASELGGSKSQFSGDPYSRLETYKDIIADRKTPSAVLAYALYRAVWCYGPSGNNSCGGKEVPESTRATWFRQLKANFPNSKWAKQLNYYW